MPENATYFAEFNYADRPATEDSPAGYIALESADSLARVYDRAAEVLAGQLSGDPNPISVLITREPGHVTLRSKTGTTTEIDQFVNYLRRNLTTYDAASGEVVVHKMRYSVPKWTEQLDNTLSGTGIYEGEEYDAGKYWPVGDILRRITPQERAASNGLASAWAAHLDEPHHPEVLTA